MHVTSVVIPTEDYRLLPSILDKVADLTFVRPEYRVVSYSAGGFVLDLRFVSIYQAIVFGQASGSVAYFKTYLASHV